MKNEIKFATKFLCDKLQELKSFTKDQIEKLSVNSQRLMIVRFQDHWHPENPLKGSAFRCMNIEDGCLDPFLSEIARKSDIPAADILSAFPHGLALWIDPCDVSYRVRDGIISPIYRRYHPKNAPKTVSVDKKERNDNVKNLRDHYYEWGVSFDKETVAEPCNIRGHYPSDANTGIMRRSHRRHQKSRHPYYKQSFENAGRYHWKKEEAKIKTKRYELSTVAQEAH